MSRSPSLFGKKTYVQPGDTVAMRLGFSEVAMHMRVADKVMPVRITTEQPHPMAQILGDFESPFSFPIHTGEAGFYTDADGIYSNRIVDVGVRWAPTSSPTRFYLFNDEGVRYLTPFRLFEEARDTALLEDGVGVRRALQARGLGPCWFRYVTIPLDAAVTYRYQAWGQSHKVGWSSQSEKITDSKILTDDATVIQCAQEFSRGWGYGFGVKDAILLDVTEEEPFITGGRQILWEG
ncbi:hypothetical protein ACWDFH_26195 [Streptomyces kronopolitis]